MHALNGFAKFALTGTLVVACGLLYSAPATAANAYRSFYQNSGSNCRGVTISEELKLRRFPQSLRNTSSYQSAVVVCNLTTDWISVGSPAQGGGGLEGNVNYVALWAKNINAGTPRTMKCTMQDGYSNEPGSTEYSLTHGPLATGSSQTPFEWTADAGKSFLAPINITCTLPPNTELNDWFVVYQVDVGA